MAASLASHSHAGLERSCDDWVRSTGLVEGVELLQAQFRRRGFSPHRHDTYGIAVTELGVQAFDYRGALERSLPGQVTVLHPDELHDGRPGTDGGFGYRIVYVAPEHIGAAAHELMGRATALPFVRQPVVVSPELASAVNDAFRSGLESLARDRLILRLTEGLLGADSSAARLEPPRRLDLPAVARARELLEARHGIVRSSELEIATGLSRYVLARQFRSVYGTSPYRYSVLRRLDVARAALRAGERLVDVALKAGFADQAHFTRMFVATFGLSPGRYARLTSAQEGCAASCVSWSSEVRMNEQRVG